MRNIMKPNKASSEDGGTENLVVVSEDLCKGCGICIAMCPMKVLEKSDKLSKRGFYVPVPAKQEKCTGCLLCQHYCPDFAIYVIRGGEAGVD